MDTMNPEQKIKPIRELLQDIGSNADIAQVPPRGLVSPKVVDRITFFASLASLVLIAAAFLAIIWDFADPVFAVRCIGTVFVLLFTLFLFRFINLQFD